MKEICTECPDFPKIPEICVKMIRRVNDEEGGIKKLVMEVFQAMWFSPVREKPQLDFPALMRKVSCWIVQSKFGSCKLMCFHFVGYEHHRRSSCMS